MDSFMYAVMWGWHFCRRLKTLSESETDRTQAVCRSGALNEMLRHVSPVTVFGDESGDGRQVHQSVVVGAEAFVQPYEAVSGALGHAVVASHYEVDATPEAVVLQLRHQQADVVVDLTAEGSRLQNLHNGPYSLRNFIIPTKKFTYTHIISTDLTHFEAFNCLI